MAIFCNRCGTELPPSARFCSSCGAAVCGPQFTAYKPLVRPLVGRRIAGVCLALAQAYNWDVALVRVFTVIGFFFSGGMVFVAYLAGWVGIPPEEYPAGI
jgi:phage shock protein PspC (stress-responsive transcriptional regulator)